MSAPEPLPRTSRRRSEEGGRSDRRGDPLQALARAARQLPQRLVREVDEHPVGVLTGVAGGAFVAGAVVGSRLGRAVLVGLTPAFVSYAVRGPIGQRARGWLADQLQASGAR